MARPAKKKSERRTDTLRIRLNAAEGKALAAAAGAKGLELSTWARMTLLEKAGEGSEQTARPAINRASGS